MKRAKGLRMTLIVVALAIAMLVSSLSLTAFGAAGDNVAVPQINIASKVEYGNSFSVTTPAGVESVKVTAPNGTDATVTDNKVKADQIGTYKVTYTSKVKSGADTKDVSYDFEVYCYLKEDYNLKVDFNGADIPTFIKQGGTVTLPSAKLVYYDKDGEEVEVATDYTISVSNAKQDVADKNKVTFDTAGNAYIKYFASFKDGKKNYSKEFSVRVQSSFEDNTAPVLNVTNVPTSAAVNKKVTLPVATATDDFDTNVKITVTVTDPTGNAVKTAIVDDETGFASVDAAGKDITFDNDKVKTFYPTAIGTYKIKYVATDDSGKTSATHSFDLEVSDNSAPIFHEIADDQIPTKWGHSVTGAADTKIKFPIPDVRDNYNAVEDLKVSFKITNADSDEIISITNILASDAKFSKTSAYDADIDVAADKCITFDLDKVKLSNDTGSFTITYRASDKKGNTASKTYTIDVVSDLDIDDAPATCELETPEYLIVDGMGDDTFTIPDYDATDANDTRLKVEYKLYSSDDDIIDDADEFLVVKKGEVANIEIRENAEFFVFDNGDELELKSYLIFDLKVTNDLGKTKTNADKVDATKSANIINVVSPKTMTAEQTFTITPSITEGGHKANEVAKLGSVVITSTNMAQYKKYTGFEVSVQDSEGTFLNNVSMETYFNSQDNELVVRNIEFTPSTQGTYILTVKAFNLKGDNLVHAYAIDVAAGTSTGGTTSSADIPLSGQLKTRYSMKTTFLKDQPGMNDAGIYFMVYKIYGGRFTLMGTEFTALSQGSYQFSDMWAEYDAGTKVVDADPVIYKLYSLSVTDTTKPDIEIQGVMPQYIGKTVAGDVTTFDKCTLPSVVAISKNGNATNMEVTIKHSKGQKVTPDYDEATNTYSFTPTRDGEYTVTYTATVNSSEAATAQFTIIAGDVVGPTVSITTIPATALKLNSEFEFSVLSASKDGYNAGTNMANFTFTKKLIAPNGETVATIEGKGKTYADKVDNGSTIKLSQVGTYVVEYTVADDLGNETVSKYKITVSASSSGPAISYAAISTVLIVVAVLAILGVILYLVRFRKVKAKQ